MGKLDLRSLIVICLLVLATVAAYLPVADCDFIYFDDPAYVTGNPEIQAGLTRSGVVWAFIHPHASNWHPITSISHMLDCQVYGLHPRGHHLASRKSTVSGPRM